MARRRQHGWARLADDELLDLRFRDLGLSLDGHWVQDALAGLNDELRRRGLRFAPHAWLSTEWFSPLGVPGIALPFYLAHPRLMQLERAIMLEVEGGNRRDCRAILRHECGHAVQQAWRLHRRKRWRELFGSSTEAYPEFYRPRPSSRRYVQHLRMYYAQSHPDEDFAETFAVWLGPKHVWRKRYAGWPALKKLEYVDELMEQIAGEVPPVRSRKHVNALPRVSTTLREHYAERVQRYPPATPDSYDSDLRGLFSEPARAGGAPRASRWLRRQRTALRRRVARWTGQQPLMVDQLLEDMLRRCRELDLRVTGDEDELRTDFALMLMAHTMRALHTHRRWVAL